MKIQFIGTGSIKDISNSASILINNHILFDIPNGNLKAMIRQKIDILKIDTLIISHTHADHCFDIPFLLWYRKILENKEEISLKIITDTVTRKTIETLIEVSHFDYVKEAKKEFINFNEIENKQILSDVNIKSIPMEHEGIEYANGYIIEDKNIKIGLTGDTCWCNGIENLAKNVDLLISDMTLKEGNKSHMGIDNILKLLKEYPNLKIIPIHMHDKTREEAKKLNKKNLNILEDGYILEI